MNQERLDFLLALAVRYPELRALAARPDAAYAIGEYLPHLDLDAADLPVLAALTDYQVRQFRDALESQFAAILPHGI